MVSIVTSRINQEISHLFIVRVEFHTPVCGVLDSAIDLHLPRVIVVKAAVLWPPLPPTF